MYVTHTSGCCDERRYRTHRGVAPWSSEPGTASSVVPVCTHPQSTPDARGVNGVPVCPLLLQKKDKWMHVATAFDGKVCPSPVPQPYTPHHTYTHARVFRTCTSSRMVLSCP